MNPRFKSYSQAGQDAFVHALIGDTGTFLDIGASHPIDLSNTYGLEQVGWNGTCVEIEHSLCELLRQKRKSKVFELDATKTDWAFILRHDTTQLYVVDYLSIDIDEGTLDALKSLMASGIKFRVITIEHDCYRFGDTLRVPEREILSAAGYILVRPDVANKETPDMPFEDFWTCAELAEKARSLP